MKKSTLKTIVITIAVLLIAAIITGVIYYVFENKKKSQTPPDDTAITHSGGMLISDEKIKSDGIQLMSAKLAPAAYAENGISPQAETAYTLTATVTPDGEYFQVVDWSLAWKNANSTWAKGKTVTDYVTVTPTSDGALTARVACKQAFGEQIKITVKCRNIPTSTAQCTVDYAKKPLSFSRSTNFSQTTLPSTFSVADGGSIACVSNCFQNSGYSTGTISIASYSDYTVDDTFTVTYQRKISQNALVRFKNSSFANKIKVENELSYAYSVEVQELDFSFVNTLFVYNAATAERFNMAAFVATWENPEDFEIWTIHFVGHHMTYSFEVNFGFSKSTLAQYATRLSLSESSITM